MSKKMSREELIDKLKQLQKGEDPEAEHGDADALLIEYIDDKEVAEAFYDIHRWYA